MHIPEAVLDPRVAAATAVLGATGLLVGLRKLESLLGERTSVLMGTMSAFIFAAQMVNFPVGPGVTGHLLGGVLAAVMLGPWAGAVVIGTVLIVQCFLFGDGGLTALGANFLNMGLIGSLGGYVIYQPIRRAIGGRRGILIGAMIAAWFSVLLAAGAFAIEIGASGSRSEFFRILSWMGLVHAAVGLGEALITGLVLRFVLLARPDLVFDPDAKPFLDSSIGSNSSRRNWLQVLFGGLGIALAIAVFLAPFAWENPDGLEFVGSKLGFIAGDTPPLLIAPLADYELPPSLMDRVSMKMATAIVGILGTLVVFGLSWGLARVFTAGSSISASEEIARDAV